ncbi:single-stranded DNA-binding protein [Sediminicoccus sp. KRV36]|uniref:single-stranded DNA-binding protein n=1 Tax=Sediminicoccus sp. KRV36 TaxID=3133721 RepID=UPI00200CF1E3|nr:single-stranded DNA-binding protein [Sediminicoccus rosea]UPY35917.1 single-stranded DNA-binding protein [Sediminicoccus rosea]
MAGINKVILLGRLGKDPEVRNFQNGGKVVKFGLATSERYKDREGNQQERTEWHDVEIYNDRLGDVAEKYLKKGSEVYIEGQIETQSFTDKDGNERKTKRIVLRQFRGELQLVGGRASGGGDMGEERSYSGGGGERSSAPARAGAPRAGWDSGKKPDMDDDIPF